MLLDVRSYVNCASLDCLTDIMNSVEILRSIERERTVSLHVYIHHLC